MDVSFQKRRVEKLRSTSLTSIQPCRTRLSRRGAESLRAANNYLWDAIFGASMLGLRLDV
jgi:hypothetical protein